MSEKSYDYDLSVSQLHLISTQIDLFIFISTYYYRFKCHECTSFRFIIINSEKTGKKISKLQFKADFL